MITSRQLYYEKQDPLYQLMPQRQTKPKPKYAKIVHKDLGREGDIGRQIAEVQAIDIDTGKIIATKQVRQFYITPSAVINIEGEVIKLAKQKGYQIK